MGDGPICTEILCTHTIKLVTSEQGLTLGLVLNFSTLSRCKIPNKVMLFGYFVLLPVKWRLLKIMHWNTSLHSNNNAIQMIVVPIPGNISAKMLTK